MTQFGPDHKGGAPLGNQNTHHSRLWKAALMRALAKRSSVDKVEALDALAEKLLLACDQADVTALRELGDRLEGKSVQQIEANVRGNLAMILGNIGRSGNDPPLEE